MMDPHAILDCLRRLLKAADQLKAGDLFAAASQMEMVAADVRASANAPAGAA
ncbi:hypothetical protein [Phenylobacterium sp.]|jgi:hypothetical protein|uniref:hypothetical protein n=1 Tax=Phenylobacterium sp. TaxID=1871053 RepID=UPI002F40C307